MSVDPRWEMVRCRECGREYRCTPSQDYFDATTLSDGLCWDCFLIDRDAPPQPEPPYLDTPNDSEEIANG